MTKAEELAESYLNGNITYVLEEVYRPLSNVTALMVMEHLPTDKQPRFWELAKEKRQEIFGL